MALWGNRDNLDSAGTVTLDYDTGVVTGSGTTFGGGGDNDAAEGDVIRFGTRTDGGSTDYHGDAVIVSIAGTQQCTIGSTMGLSGAAISGEPYQISQLPVYTIKDASYSDNPLYNQESPSIRVIDQEPILVASGAGVSILAVNSIDMQAFGNVVFGDFVVDNGTPIQIAGFGTGTVEVTSASPVGFNTIFIPTAQVPGLVVGSRVSSGTAGTTFTTDGLGVNVASIGSTFITLESPVDALIALGQVILINDPFIISLASTISQAFGVGEEVTIGRRGGGYDKYLYGVSGDGAAAAEGSSFQVAHGGWVGVTTYIDNHGNFRVKTETLVAASGIETGNTPIYDADPSA